MAEGTHWNPPKEVIWEILAQIESIRSDIQELRQFNQQMNEHQRQIEEPDQGRDRNQLNYGSLEVGLGSMVHELGDPVGKPIIFSNSEQESNNRSLLVEKNEDQEEIEDTHQIFDGMPMKNSSISDQDFGVNRESDFGHQDQSMDEILRVESIDFEADRYYSPEFVGEGNNRFFKLNFGVKNEFYSSENKSFAPNEKDELFDMGKLIETEMGMNGSRTISVSHVGKSTVHDMFDEMPSRSFKGSLKREECGLNLMIGSGRNGSKMMLGFEYGSWILGPSLGDTISVFDPGMYRAEIESKIVAQNYGDTLHEFGEMFHVELQEMNWTGYNGVDMGILCKEFSRKMQASGMVFDPGIHKRDGYDIVLGDRKTVYLPMVFLTPNVVAFAELFCCCPMPFDRGKSHWTV